MSELAGSCSIKTPRLMKGVVYSKVSTPTISKGEHMKVSNCCCAPPYGETHDDLGFCSECMEHAVFEGEEDEDLYWNSKGRTYICKP